MVAVSVLPKGEDSPLAMDSCGLPRRGPVRPPSNVVTNVESAVTAAAEKEYYAGSTVNAAITCCATAKSSESERFPNPFDIIFVLLKNKVFKPEDPRQKCGRGSGWSELRRAA